MFSFSFFVYINHISKLKIGVRLKSAWRIKTDTIHPQEALLFLKAAYERVYEGRNR